MNTKIWKIVLVLSLFAVTACAGNSAASLEGTSWQLVSLAGNALVTNTRPTMSFEDGRVGGNSSCNTFGGEYKVQGDNIEFGVMMSTMMACADNNAMMQEQEYLAFLGTVETWKLDNGQLLLFDANGDMLVFESQN